MQALPLSSLPCNVDFTPLLSPLPLAFSVALSVEGEQLALHE